MDEARLAARPARTLKRRFPVAPEKARRAWTGAQALKRRFGPGGTDRFFTHARHFNADVRDARLRGGRESFVNLDGFPKEKQA